MLYRILRVFFTKSGHIRAVLSHPCKARRIFVTRAIFSTFLDVSVKWALFKGFTGTYSPLTHYSRELKSVAVIHTYTCMLSMSVQGYT